MVLEKNNVVPEHNSPFQVIDKHVVELYTDFKCFLFSLKGKMVK